MDKKSVASALEEIAACLELKGEDRFRVRAYETAARAIAGYEGDLREALHTGELAQLKGIGPATLEVVSEVLKTGRSRTLQTLRDQVPSGLVEMLQISGLGVAKVRQIHETLLIDSLDELEEAARNGTLSKLPRFGPKTAEKILKGIQFVRQVREFRLLHHARQEAAALAGVLEGMPGVTRVATAGSVRRGREVIRDLDFVVALEGKPSALVERLGTAPGVREFVHESDRVLTLRFAGGTVADVYWTSERGFGYQLLRATGNDDHLASLKVRAEEQGLTWGDCDLSREGEIVSTPSEEDIYHAVGLPFIVPELREGKGEVETAAAGRLPQLIETADIRGFLHCHSNYSDGRSTVREWAEACQLEGYEYLGITDHSLAAAYAGGITLDQICEQHAEIDAVNQELADLRVLKGVEADILTDGSLDYTPQVRASFDFIIASVHSTFGMTERKMTERILKAMDDPSMAILGHPTGRLLLSRDPYPLDLGAVFTKAADCGIAVEINADPQRLDLDWQVVRQAAELGVTISIGADAHSVAALSNMELGVTVARKGWLTKGQVINSRPLEGFLEYVERRRSRN
ncbi:MAG: DNA polymerase/3'-5' exonuclease PolX [Gemmatimonadales bacterium]|nr:DNA polymerase/3'-5' exonuclease PolX [Gemmatimonadales bacterium]NIN10634.1 DNA polymerase/3'-5' exonuclease PolX [Gemmatimonadales bacterium]NIN49396.1 DNA polymerase/3'-5' exonuclease PolX [Gemmatimonadales bacterium]NIP06860.1 DNA polymerase/3'-5' exonuclease PolX [Gemmatimonadales bacterium]NIR01534.1 DNA polymerase/3'-5' exonuclease PolX [Gemmatimonadales bacterium]